MSDKTGNRRALESIVGKTVGTATSSLTQLSIQLDHEEGVVFEAVGDARSPSVAVKLVKSAELPSLSEAVCSVDWSWLKGSTVEEARPGSASVNLRLAPAGPLVVSALVWEGKPFLSFKPYKPAAR